MGIWFETGNKMEDGTPRTVYAEGVIAIAEARKKRWRPVAPDDGTTPATPDGVKISGVTGVSTARRGPAHDVMKNDLQEEDVATTEEIQEEFATEEVATEEPATEEIQEKSTTKESEKSKRGRRKKA